MTKKMIHEQVADNFNVDLSNVEYQRLQFLTKDMIKDIVEKCIKNIEIVPSEITENESMRSLILVFDSSKKAVEFEKQFGNNIFGIINEYLTENNYNPSKFNRKLSVMFDGQQEIRTIQY